MKNIVQFALPFFVATGLIHGCGDESNGNTKQSSSSKNPDTIETKQDPSNPPSGESTKNLSEEPLLGWWLLEYDNSVADGSGYSCYLMHVEVNKAGNGFRFDTEQWVNNKNGCIAGPTEENKSTSENISGDIVIATPTTSWNSGVPVNIDCEKREINYFLDLPCGSISDATYYTSMRVHEIEGIQIMQVLTPPYSSERGKLENTRLDFKIDEDSRVLKATRWNPEG